MSLRQTFSRLLADSLKHQVIWYVSAGMLNYRGYFSAFYTRRHCERWHNVATTRILLFLLVQVLKKIIIYHKKKDFLESNRRPYREIMGQFEPSVFKYYYPIYGACTKMSLTPPTFTIQGNNSLFILQKNANEEGFAGTSQIGHRLVADRNSSVARRGDIHKN